MVNPNPTLPYVLPSEANQNSVVEVFNIYNSNLWRVAPKLWTDPSKKPEKKKKK